MWYVYNISHTHGYAFKTRSKTIARIVAHAMGGHHDYGQWKDARMQQFDYED